MSIAFKVGAAVAALVLLQRHLGARATLASEYSTKTDAKGCGACYRFTYLADGTIRSERVADALCEADGLTGLGCPSNDLHEEPSDWLDPSTWFDGAKWGERLEERANQLDQVVKDLGF